MPNEPNTSPTHYTQIQVSAAPYEDLEDCLTAAAEDYADEHGLPRYQVTAAGWASEERNEITLDVPVVTPCEVSETETCNDD